MIIAKAKRYQAKGDSPYFVRQATSNRIAIIAERNAMKIPSNKGPSFIVINKAEPSVNSLYPDAAESVMKPSKKLNSAALLGDKPTQ